MKRNLKMISTMLLVCTLVLSACGGSNANKGYTLEDLNGKTIGLPSSSRPQEAFITTIDFMTGVKVGKVDYYDTRLTCITAVKSGKAAAAYAPDFLANYYASIDDSLAALVAPEDHVCTVNMVVRDDDTELLQTLNDGIKALRESGMLDTLALQHVNSMADPEESNEGIAKIDGAKTVVIGMSGDSAPLDYLTLDGKPAGYNVAVLNELGKLTNLNFEVVNVKSNANFAALQSKKIDVFFVQIVPQDSQESIKALSEKNHVTFTEPYFTFARGAFIVNK